MRRVFNAELMKEAYGDDEKLAMKMLRELIRSTGSLIRQLQCSLILEKGPKPLKEIKETIHKLKGSVR